MAVKIVKATPTHVTYVAKLWNQNSGKHYEEQFTAERRCLGASMSTEFARRHGLDKYAVG